MTPQLTVAADRLVEVGDPYYWVIVYRGDAVPLEWWGRHGSAAEARADAARHFPEATRVSAFPEVW